MTGDRKTILEQAKTALQQHLQKMGCAVVAENPEPQGETLVVKSAIGRPHHILVQLLNLDEARSAYIPQSVFGYQPKADCWILLVLYMSDMEPSLYLIPSTVFNTSNHIFINNLQGERFRHLSNWEIKIFRNAVAELNQYTLHQVRSLDRP